MFMRENSGIVTFLMASLLCLNTSFVQNSWAASGSYSTSKSETLVSGHESAQYYCSKADESSAPEKQANLLLCANAYLHANKNAQARDILNGLKNFHFDSKLAAYKSMVEARYAYNLGNSARALSLLTPLNAAPMSLPVSIEYHDLLARVYENEGELMKSVEERVTLDGLLSDREQASLNNNELWAVLDRINLRSLQAAAKHTENKILKGWLELAMIERQISQDDPQYAQQLETWQKNFRGHPGEAMLPSSLEPIQNFHPQKIALLLPLSGPLSSSAQAIRDGFLASSYWQAKISHHSPQITVIDTQNDKEVAKAYEAAVEGGAEMIVGPLTKAGVEVIMNTASKNIPVLALNYVDEHAPPNLTLFGLSPEDEARQVADKAWEDGHRNALILAQAGEWGDRLTRAFEQHWQNLGGVVVNKTSFSPDEPLSGPVKAALGVDSSEARAKALKADLDHPIDFEARRRQDLDMIFIAAQPREAHQLPPLLAFYYAHDIPVYATSSIYSGYANPHADKDLNGVTFCDIPWNTDARPADNLEESPVAALWPSPDQPYPRLYALGIDAYQLIALLPRLEALPYFAYNGATGKLTLDKNRNIDRSLHCTKFVNGEPKRLQSNV